MLNWVLLAILVCFISAMEVIIMKKISFLKTEMQIDDSILLTFIIIGFVSFVIFFFKTNNIKQKIKTVFNKNGLLIILFAILLLLNKILFTKALKNAPNPGYPRIIVNLNIIIVLILSYLFYNSKINIYTLFGIILSLIGIYIVIRYSDFNP